MTFYYNAAGLLWIRYAHPPAVSELARTVRVGEHKRKRLALLYTHAPGEREREEIRSNKKPQSHQDKQSVVVPQELFLLVLLLVLLLV